jgi:hypothetical protein
MNATKTLIDAVALSHADQLRGRDYQAAAIDAAEWLGCDFESDEYTELQHEPSPGCECAACRGFDWPD